MSQFRIISWLVWVLLFAIPTLVSAQPTEVLPFALPSSPSSVGMIPDSSLPSSVVPSPSSTDCDCNLDSISSMSGVQPRRRGLLHLDTEDGPKPFTPFMLGDFVGPISNTFSDVKIAEGESPRPVNRAFFHYNYFNNFEPSRFENPSETLSKVDLHRWTFGFEQTFADQLFSLGLRIPFNTVDANGRDFVLATGEDGMPTLVPGETGFTTTQFGNATAIIKAVLSEDRESGNLLSGGLIISFPSASTGKIDIAQSTVFFLQPWAGYIWNYGDWFIHGFSSVTAPIIGPLQVMMFNDVGVGYYAYRAACSESLLTAIVPTVEVHVATPLKKLSGPLTIAGVTQQSKIRDVVDLTAGATFEIANSATLGLGVAVPILGVRTFDFEVMAQLNVRY